MPPPEPILTRSKTKILQQQGTPDIPPHTVPASLSYQADKQLRNVHSPDPSQPQPACIPGQQPTLQSPDDSVNLLPPPDNESHPQRDETNADFNETINTHYKGTVLHDFIMPDVTNLIEDAKPESTLVHRYNLRPVQKPLPTTRAQRRDKQQLIHNIAQNPDLITGKTGIPTGENHALPQNPHEVNQIINLANSHLY